MSLYEHVFIARPNISAQRMKALMDDFSAVVKNGGGSVAETEYWGLRNLAYRIGKNRKGHYAMLNIEAPHEALAEMERQMRLHEDIMRFLSVKVEKFEEEPSVPMQQRLNAEAAREAAPDIERRSSTEASAPEAEEKPEEQAATETAEEAEAGEETPPEAEAEVETETEEETEAAPEEKGDEEES